VSLRVASDLEAQHRQAETLWNQRMQRARFEADRAHRQFDAVEPENRLVARTLERAWEEKLHTYEQLVEEHRRAREQQIRPLDADQQQRIRRLADDIPALWHHPDTRDEDRKAILRHVIDRVVVRVVDQTQWVEARVHWAGGDQTHTQLRRPVARLEQLSDWQDIRRTVLEMKANGHTAPAIADRLNAEGWRTTSGKPFTAGSVRTWLSRYGPPPPKRRRPDDRIPLSPNQWLLPELARHLGISHQTLRGWIQRDRLNAHQADGKRSRWIIDADPDQLRRLVDAHRARPNHPDKAD
jgi:DNA-binding transcriptional MerR regulator